MKVWIRRIPDAKSGCQWTLGALLVLFMWRQSSISCGYPGRVRMGECQGRNSDQRNIWGPRIQTAVGSREQFVRVCMRRNIPQRP